MQRRSLMTVLVAAVAAGVWRAAGAQEASSKPFTPEQLDQILAPIALYPDALLAQTLMAAGYPLEVVEAARWSKANPALKGDAAVAAVKDKSWDVSVKSLVAFPQVLMQLSDHLDWMQKVGDAMIAQQQDVADSIQRLRARAADAGNLQNSKEQTVTTQGSGAERTIVIAPANPEVIYVPAYNPNTVYGTWPYPAYPPTYYPPPPGYGYGSALLRGLMFGIGIAAAGAIFGGWNWGRGNSYVNVNINRAVNIDRNFNVNNINNGRWQHEPIHRKGVAYRDPATRQRFNQTRPGADQRQEFRGRLENQPRPQANARPNQPNRPAGGPAQRPNVTNRAAGGQHPNFQNHAGAPRGGGAIRGVDNGQQVNREAARGRAQQSRAATHASGGGGARPGGGGGGAARAGGGNRGGGRQ